MQPLQPFKRSRSNPTFSVLPGVSPDPSRRRLMPTTIKAKKHFNPKPEDHPRMSEALDVSTVQTSHVCNNRHPDTCRNPACLLIGGPAGA